MGGGRTSPILLSLDEAIKITMSGVAPLGCEQISVEAALHRVLASNITAERDQPPWDNAQMDGYAVLSGDIKTASPNAPVGLRVVGRVMAGDAATVPITTRQAVRIMTGAPIPLGADSVVKVEDTDGGDDIVQIRRASPPGAYVRQRGEDVQSGSVVLHSGEHLTPARIGMLAATGHASVSVYRRPRVAILATGNELVEPGLPIGNHQIRNSNSYTLAAQVCECGGVPVRLGIAVDTHQDLREKIARGLSSDMLLIAGGVSAGEADLVLTVWKELGVELKFWKVAMRPGHPLAFGTFNGRPLFGLPGNPVSSMVTFEQVVRPLLFALSGFTGRSRPLVEAIVSAPIYKPRGFCHFVRAAVSFVNGAYHATVTGNQGSGILSSMVLANGLIVLPEACEHVNAGDRVQVQLLTTLP